MALKHSCVEFRDLLTGIAEHCQGQRRWSRRSSTRRRMEARTPCQIYCEGSSLSYMLPSSVVIRSIVCSLWLTRVVARLLHKVCVSAAPIICTRALANWLQDGCCSGVGDTGTADRSSAAAAGFLQSRCMPQRPVTQAADSSALGKQFSLRRSLSRRSRAAVAGKRSSLAAVPALLPLLLRLRHAQHCSALATAAAAIHTVQLQPAVIHRAARQGAACRCMAAAPLAAADIAASGPSLGPADGSGCAAALDQLSVRDSNVGKQLPCNGRPTVANGTASAGLRPAAAAVCGAAQASSSAGAASPAVEQPLPSHAQQPAEPPDALPSSQSPALRFEVLTHDNLHA
jgi:hypothetical protein